jgi:anthranilate/para-aminobenzoate synthase component I
MIVDLIRNDFGRVCEFGSVTVDNICEIETHPTLFHLVSTVRGRLRSDMRLSGIIRATFPCGSITGAPKISTMKIIDRLETANRGLSMGAIGFCGPNIGELINGRVVRTRDIQMSVAIRTMTLSDGKWRFNVGGGIVIDSDPDCEYEETLTKARALLGAIGGVFSGNKSNPAESKNAEDRV